MDVIPQKEEGKLAKDQAVDFHVHLTGTNLKKKIINLGKPFRRSPTFSHLKYFFPDGGTEFMGLLQRHCGGARNHAAYQKHTIKLEGINDKIKVSRRQVSVKLL